MNLRVRRVTGVSESAILTINLSTMMIVWWWVKMGECWSWEYFFSLAWIERDVTSAPHNQLVGCARAGGP